ncbi:MAG: 3'-5' exonuclease [Fibrobacterales bacterium]|nr:3'-5' exonuclease [Fibrobacterales bacterium]
MSKQIFIAFDTETTGLDKDHDQIIEIAGVKFTVDVRPDGLYAAEIVDEWESLVKPTMLIPAEASAVNHITDRDVENAPSAAEVLEKFRAFCGSTSILVAHNAQFDCDFVSRAVAAARLPRLRTKVYDSLRVARAVHPEYANHKLSYVAKMLTREHKIEMPPVDAAKLHRACYDCEVLAYVFTGLLHDGMARPADLQLSVSKPSIDKLHGGEPLSF